MNDADPYNWPTWRVSYIVCNHLQL
jgi:hypothetical protein